MVARRRRRRPAAGPLDTKVDETDDFGRFGARFLLKDCYTGLSWTCELILDYSSDQLNRTGIAVSRREAIEALGVRYTHNGRPGTAVRERLGAVGVPEDPMNPVSTFASDEDALQHAVELTREASRQEVLAASLELAPYQGAWRVWLGRHWNPARRWFREDLSAVAILERRIAAAGKMVTGASMVSIERLDDVICIPATLAAGTAVFAVDTSGFPRSPVTLQPMIISEVHYLETPGHPLFHVVPRYKIDGMPGYYAYDHVEADEEAMSSPSSRGPTMYLDEDAAKARVSMFVNAVREMLDRGAQPAIMLPPPPPTLPVIAAQTAVPMALLQNSEAVLIEQPTMPPTEVVGIEAPVIAGFDDVTIDVEFEVHEVATAASSGGLVDKEAAVDVPLGDLPDTQAPCGEIASADYAPFTDLVATDIDDEVEAEPIHVPAVAPVEDRLEALPLAAVDKPSRGLGAFLRLIGGEKAKSAVVAGPPAPLVAVSQPEPLVASGGEFSRFAASGVKIRRWDNADGRESLARIALETLA